MSNPLHYNINCKKIQYSFDERKVFFYERTEKFTNQSAESERIAGGRQQKTGHAARTASA
jgi:hypothetical protein